MAAGLAVGAAGRWSELVQFARDYVKPTDAAAGVLLIAAAWTTKCALSLLMVCSLQLQPLVTDSVLCKR